MSADYFEPLPGTPRGKTYTCIACVDRFCRHAYMCAIRQLNPLPWALEKENGVRDVLFVGRPVSFWFQVITGWLQTNALLSAKSWLLCCSAYATIESWGTACTDDVQRDTQQVIHKGLQGPSRTPSGELSVMAFGGVIFMLRVRTYVRTYAKLHKYSKNVIDVEEGKRVVKHVKSS